MSGKVAGGCSAQKMTEKILGRLFSGSAPVAARHTFRTFRPLKLLEIGRFSNATAALGVKESRKQLIKSSNNNWRQTFKSSDLVHDQTLSFHSKH